MSADGAPNAPPRLRLASHTCRGHSSSLPGTCGLATCGSAALREADLPITLPAAPPPHLLAHWSELRGQTSEDADFKERDLLNGEIAPVNSILQGLILSGAVLPSALGTKHHSSAYPQGRFLSQGIKSPSPDRKTRRRSPRALGRGGRRADRSSERGTRGARSARDPRLSATGTAAPGPARLAAPEPRPACPNSSGLAAGRWRRTRPVHREDAAAAQTGRRAVREPGSAPGALARSRRSARGAGLLEGEPLTDLGHAGHEDPERDDVGVLDVVPFEGDHLEALARVLSVAGPLLDAQRPRHLTQRQQQRQRQSPAGARGPAPRHLRAAQRAVQTRMSWDSGCARGNALARAQPRTLGVQAAVPVPRPPGWPLIWRPPPALGRGLPAPAARTRAQTPPPPGTPSRV